jgi:hypothetical protein
MKPWARKLMVFFCLALCIGVVLLLTKNFWSDQFLAYGVGKIDLAARQYQQLPEDIDTVEVFTLKNSPFGNTNGFVGDEQVATVSHKTLKGNDAREIVDLWGKFPIGAELQDMCFQPAYGLQFKRKGQIYF